MSNGKLLETQVNTYHCLCANLVLATTHDLTSLPRRAESVSDRAIIITSLLPSADIREALLRGDDLQTFNRAGSEYDGYAILCSIVSPASSQPIMIRREDGFEKRYVVRCGQCKVILGYHLDWAQSLSGEQKGQESGRGPRDEVLYMLPGAVMPTGDMIKGLKPLPDVLEFGLLKT